MEVESGKECVSIQHSCLKRANETQSLWLHDAAMNSRAWSLALGVSLSETALGPDVGGRIKFSNESKGFM